MPKFDFSLLEEEEEDKYNYIKVPRFGYAFDTKINSKGFGKWIHVEDKSIWALTIRSDGALSINLIFDDFFLTEGAEFNIFNANKTMRFGPVTTENSRKSRKLSTDIIEGSEITLILIEPKSSENPQSYLSISKVVHGYTTACNGETYLDCHINASCTLADGLEDEKYAVARIIVHSGQGCCSGVLINNACNDLTPYFLTAFHCIDFDYDRDMDPNEEEDIEDWVFRYQYISPNCTPTSQPSSWVTYSGAQFIAQNDETDFLLVRMENQPTASTGLKYAGWSIDDEFSFQNEGTTSLHHPAGAVIKFSSDYHEPVENINGHQFCYTEYDCFIMVAGTLWEIDIDAGAIEWGSSGGPLFDPDNRIIGQLVGGNIRCPIEPASYGRISESWDRSATNDEQLEYWLDPEELSVTETNTISIPYISGDDLVCYSPNKTFTLNNRATGTTVTWTKSSNLSYVSGQGTDSYTVRAYSSLSSGAGWVQASISTSTCDAVVVQKYFDVGCPEIGDLVFTNDLGEEDFLCSDREGNLVEFSSSTCYNYFDIWLLNEYGTQVLDKSKTYTTQGSLDFSWISPGYYLVQVRGINDCGTGEWNGSEVEYVDCSEMEEGENMYYLKFVPNPAYNSVEISVFEDENLTILKTNNEFYQMQIYNSMKVLKYQVLSKEPILRINTANFENGVYFVYFVVGKETQVLQLVISH